MVRRSYRPALHHKRDDDFTVRQRVQRKRILRRLVLLVGGRRGKPDVSVRLFQRVKVLRRHVALREHHARVASPFFATSSTMTAWPGKPPLMTTSPGAMSASGRGLSCRSSELVPAQTKTVSRYWRKLARLSSAFAAGLQMSALPFALGRSPADQRLNEIGAPFPVSLKLTSFALPSAVQPFGAKAHDAVGALLQVLRADVDVDDGGMNGLRTFQRAVVQEDRRTVRLGGSPRGPSSSFHLDTREALRWTKRCSIVTPPSTPHA